ncbi:MAG: hypothetical protein QXQ40_00805 [Candidatus Aenigmatarchaeota archaeon]
MKERFMNNKILILALVIVFIIITVIACITLKQGEKVGDLGQVIMVNNDEDAPSSPMDLILLSTPFSVEKVATISVKIGKREGYPTEGVNWPGTNAELILPEGLKLIEGNLHWQGDIIGDEVAQFQVKVQAIQNGEWKVEAYAKYLIDETNWLGDMERFYILVTDDTVLISEQPFTPISPGGKGEK